MTNQNKLSNSEELKITRPEPLIPSKQPILYKRTKDVKKAVEQIIAGEYIQIDDFYGTGLVVLEELTNNLKEKHKGNSFQGQRDFRAEYRKFSHQVIIKIKEHELDVKKEPVIGWIEVLYPEMDEFFLPFPIVQGLNSSWQWYQNGVNIPTVRNKVHPYYGVYFPTRFSHLQLFDNWLKRYEGPKKFATEVGIGSGVLSFQMVQAGFQKVLGTDTNPNAIFGLKEFMGETKISRKIELDFAHLFGKFDKEVELIVFNPPWLPTSKELDRLDEAIYYNDKLFPEFFAEAKKRLLPDGKLVLLFSNLAQITKAADTNPIEEEIEKGGRFKLDLKLTKSTKKSSLKTKREQSWRAEEYVELWVLTHADDNAVVEENSDSVES